MSKKALDPTPREPIPSLPPEELQEGVTYLVILRGGKDPFAASHREPMVFQGFSPEGDEAFFLTAQGSSPFRLYRNEGPWVYGVHEHLAEVRPWDTSLGKNPRRR